MQKARIYTALKIILILLFSIVFIGAGANHFINPQNYYPIMPGYLPFPETLNILAGVLEIVFGIGLVFKSTIRSAAYGIILLLILFFTVHIYMIQEAPMQMKNLKVTETLAWIRLILQFLMIWLAWLISRFRLSIFSV